MNPSPLDFIQHPTLPKGNFLLHGCFPNTSFDFGDMPITVRLLTNEEVIDVVTSYTIDHFIAFMDIETTPDNFIYADCPFSPHLMTIENFAAKKFEFDLDPTSIFYQVHKGVPLFIRSSDPRDQTFGFIPNPAALELADMDNLSKYPHCTVFTSMLPLNRFPNASEPLMRSDPALQNNNNFINGMNEFGHVMINKGKPFDDSAAGSLVKTYLQYAPNKSHMSTNNDQIFYHFQQFYPFVFARDEDNERDRRWRCDAIKDPILMAEFTLLFIWSMASEEDYCSILDTLKKIMMFLDFGDQIIYHAVRWLCFDHKVHNYTIDYVNDVVHFMPHITKIRVPLNVTLMEGPNELIGFSNAEIANMYPKGFEVNKFNMTLAHYAAINDNIELFKILYAEEEIKAPYPTMCDLILQLSYHQSPCLNHLLQRYPNYFVNNPSVYPLWSLAHNRRCTKVIPFKHMLYPGFKTGIPHLPDLEDLCVAYGNMFVLKYLVTNNITTQTRIPHSPEHPHLCSALGMFLADPNKNHIFLAFRNQGLYAVTKKIHVCEETLVRAVNGTSEELMRAVLGMKFANSSWPFYYKGNTKIPIASLALPCVNIDAVLHTPNMPPIEKLIIDFEQWQSIANEIIYRDKPLTKLTQDHIKQCSLLDLFMLYGDIKMLSNQLLKHFTLVTPQTRSLMKYRTASDRMKIIQVFLNMDMLLDPRGGGGGGGGGAVGKSKKKKKSGSQKKKQPQAKDQQAKQTASTVVDDDDEGDDGEDDDKGVVNMDALKDIINQIGNGSVKSQSTDDDTALQPAQQSPTTTTTIATTTAATPIIQQQQEPAPVEPTPPLPPSPEVSTPQPTVADTQKAVEEPVPVHYERSVGKFKFSKKLIIGRGSNGTLVYKGVWCDKVPVAIKQLFKEFNTLIDKEVEILIQLTALATATDNLVRFFGMEEDDNFIYLATSLCEMSLQEMVEVHRTRFQSLNKQTMINDIVNGVRFLHQHNIIHNDLNPRNILFKDKHLFITDMGLSKMSVETSFAFTHAPSGQGGYFPSEVIKDQRKTNSVDIFSLGCLMYYILTDGGHPFGDEIHRRVTKIIDNHFNLSQLTDNYAVDLITQMIEHDSASRPTIQTVINHPFFWDINKRQSFIIRVSQSIQNQSHTFLNTTTDKQKYLRQSWNMSIDSKLLDQLNQETQYNFNNVKDLVRCIRNTTLHHHHLFTDSSKTSTFFTSQQSAFQYFEQRHPTLVLHLYHRLRGTTDVESDNLKEFYPNSL
ncbi:hypothetical protein SAMD00019534_033330 [Acytostelium subglobosum LB1]|uniref:hypothetical protein n=1 Tax=Acytostelium subglobosum LB1 TaxID=1410327 RepID=UPI0006447DE3|nr:hypothetical protein SAMD00019534_033330 [Acytostelium subglobosum LB1]GAM20158.1 hypothetical protein SAMD00019534_033330 [Acytostelium subglobosum LB1]|eukprot:XP_012759679.1 hypothetical protein SAMD00019534_033330 [Acytostelium subglobosum LB1]